MIVFEVLLSKERLGEGIELCWFFSLLVVGRGEKLRNRWKERKKKGTVKEL